VTASPDRAPPGTPLYLHLPYCVTKCPYCDFYSVEAEGQDLDGLVDALLVEAERRAPERPRTVFVGGGTPSLLPRPALRRLLDGLDALTGFRAAADEVTAECNPESLDEAQAAALVALGVTRLSIGVQALDPEALALLGRVHSADEALASLRAARAAGAPRISADLIYAWPGQEVDAWRRDLDRVLALGVEHVSAYALTFEEGTPFHRWRAEGRIAQAPEERELALFEATHEHLGAAGLEAYEVSNFALSAKQCAHNVNYWLNGPYVGLGPSAASLVGGRRSANVRSVDGWTRRLAAGRSTEAWSEELGPRERLGETWWLGLRLTAGLEPERARRTAGFEGDEDPALALARRFEDEGLLEILDGRYRLSPRGRPLADAIAREFLTCPHPDSP